MKRPTIKEIRQGLEKIPRHGFEKDEPEGARYVVISDTLLNLIIKALKKHE